MEIGRRCARKTMTPFGLLGQMSDQTLAGRRVRVCGRFETCPQVKASDMEYRIQLARHASLMQISCMQLS